MISMSLTRRRAIAKRLRELRGDRSENAWADYLGVAQQNVNRWLYRDDPTVPGAESLMVIAKKHHVSIDWILTGYGAGRSNRQRA